MDSIDEGLLLLGGLLLASVLMFYLVPSSASIGSQFQSQAVSQIILNSFNLVSSQINGTVNYASIYDNGFPTTLYVTVTQYNASNNQVETTISERVSFVSGLNKISLPSSVSNSYYEIELYNPSGNVLYTTYYVYKYVNDYLDITNIVGNNKIFINGKEVKLNTLNNSAILSLPSGIYNISIFTPFYYYSKTITFPLSAPLSINIPSQTQYAQYTAYVDQMLPGNKLNPLPSAVLSLNNETATYKTNSTGSVMLSYSSGDSVLLNISCPASTCGTSITNNYTSLSGVYTTNDFSSSTPFILYPKFRVIGNLYLTCNGTSYPTPGSVSVEATPSNTTRNKYGEVNASGEFVSYLYAGLYNITGISLSGLFNSTEINVTHYNQTFSLSFPYCVTHVPYNETIFEESGLPSNTPWNVTYGGALNKSNTDEIVFSEVDTRENYTYSIPNVSVNGVKFVPVPSSGASPTKNKINVDFVVPITIQNTQSVATSAPFQQELQFSESTYSNYINYNGNTANFEFLYKNLTVIPSWIESNSSGTITVWLDLAKGIPASSSITVYMKFAPMTTNLLSSSGASGIGEAPTLSSTYAQYDDGAKVFLSYFNGATNTGWTTSSSSTGIETSPTGAPFGSSAFYANSGDNYQYISLSALTNPANVIINYFTYTTGSTPLGDFFFTSSSTGVGTMSRLDGRGGTDYCGFANTTSWTDFSAPDSGVSCSANTWYLWTIVINGGQVADYYNTDLTNIGVAGTQINALSSTYQIYTTTSVEKTYANDGSYIGLQGDGGSGTTYWQGIIVRAYPPNGVMPTYTFD